jgi:tetratricopeptide (TPR) repeat protein
MKRRTSTLTALLAFLLIPTFFSHVSAASKSEVNSEVQSEAGRFDLDAATAAFQNGNAAYERGDFESAEKSYAVAESRGASDARLYYNRANALYRLNRLGPAILYYEKARKLAPTDADILHNLNFARARVADKIPEPAANLLTQTLWRLHTSYSAHAGLWIAFGLFAAGFLALAVGLFQSTTGRLATALVAALAFTSLLLFSPSLLYKLRQQESAVRAVVLQPVAEVYSGPGESYELLFRAHEGTVFTIVSREGSENEWLAVKLPDGRGGYVRAAKVGEV